MGNSAPSANLAPTPPPATSFEKEPKPIRSTYCDKVFFLVCGAERSGKTHFLQNFKQLGFGTAGDISQRHYIYYELSCDESEADKLLNRLTAKVQPEHTATILFFLYDETDSDSLLKTVHIAEKLSNRLSGTTPIRQTFLIANQDSTSADKKVAIPSSSVIDYLTDSSLLRSATQYRLAVSGLIEQPAFRDLRQTIITALGMSNLEDAMSDIDELIRDHQRLVASQDEYLETIV